MEILKESRFPHLWKSAVPVEMKGHTYSDLFKAGNSREGYYSVKVRNKNLWQIKESLHCLSELKDPECSVLPYCEILETENCFIFISPWIDGIQPVDSLRESLPCFFEQLALLNKNNPVNNSCTSMYVDGRLFKSVEELVDYETTLLLKSYRGKRRADELRELLKPLKEGFACIVHEDMNTGNLILDRRGKALFLDTEYLLRGVHLYQFEHINLMNFSKAAWYNITGEARECLQAYFSVLGTPCSRASEELRAYFLLAQLRMGVFLESSGQRYSWKTFDSEAERILKVRSFL